MNDVIDKKHQESWADTTGDLQSTVEEAKSSVEENLSAEPLTADQKIEQLTDQVHKLTLGINEMIKFFGIMMKGQIEGTQSTDALTKSMKTLDKSLDDNFTSIESSRDKKNAEVVKKFTEIINKIQEDNVYKQRALAKALKAILENDGERDAVRLLDQVFKPDECWSRR